MICGRVGELFGLPWSSLTTHFRPLLDMRLIYAYIAHVKNEFKACTNGKIQKEQEQTEAQPDGA